MDERAAIVAANVAGIHTVLAVCGVVDPDNSNLIRTGNGLTFIADFGVFYSNRDVVDCATTDTKYTCVLTIVLRVVTGTKHHNKEHLLGYYAQDIRM